MRLLLAIPLLFAASCTGIPHGWQAARHEAPQDGVSGAWIGSWKSSVNGHSGGLRAVVTRKSGDTWHFRYRASWAKILCAGFSMEAQVKPAAGQGMTITGSHDLGSLFGGVFSCEGTIRDGVFRAAYSAKVDSGEMEMKRVTTSR